MADDAGPFIAAAMTAANRPQRKRTVVGFAGGGGSSIAIAQALGVEPDAALNHWPLAGEVHLVNFPACEFHCADITETNPMEVIPGEAIGLLWLSPDCRHFSKAKGGAPVSPRVRGLAWVALPWARLRRPDVIMLENVGEFLTWGPVGPDGQPVAELKGTTFDRWKRRLEKIGYVVDHRILSAADFGAPTIRKRLFLIARCDGLPIVWPEPTHAPRNSEAVKRGEKLPYRAAAEIIDWSRHCPSIFLTPDEARVLRVKRPLKEATLKRIAKGLKRYTIEAAEPFIVQLTHQGADRMRSTADQLPTITGAHRGEMALVSPVITGCGGRLGQTEPVDPRDPYATITSKNDSCLAAAHMVRTDMTGAKYAGQNSAEDPLRTNTSGGGLGTAVAYLQTMSENGVGSHPDDPLWAAMAQAPRHYLVAGHLVPRYSEREGQAPRAHDAAEPAPTIPGQANLVAAHLKHAYTSNTVGEPLATSTAKARLGLTEAWLAPPETVSPREAALRAFLAEHYGAPEPEDLADPLGSPLSRARLGLVVAGGEVFRIVDIGMRMLDPETELAAAMGVPPGYVLGRDTGDRPISKTDITKMVGNMVSPPPARALIAANCGHLKEGVEA